MRSFGTIIAPSSLFALIVLDIPIGAERVLLLILFLSSSLLVGRVVISSGKQLWNSWVVKREFSNGMAGLSVFLPFMILLLLFLSYPLSYMAGDQKMTLIRGVINDLSGKFGSLVSTVIALVVSGLSQIRFGFVLGILIGLCSGVALLILTVALIANAIERRKPCAHGVRRGKDGGCTACIAEEQSRLAEEKRLQADWKAKEERKRQISSQARALRNLQLRTLRKRWLSNSERYFEMEPQEFENAIAELFRQLGYEVKQTPYANDRGKDAIALKEGKKYLIECKRYGADNTIGRRELQIFVAAMKEENALGGFYINTGRFARTVPEYAQQNQIELYDRARLPELVNRAYPAAEDVSTAKVICLECGAEASLPVGDIPTSGTCANGHQVKNDITTHLIRATSFQRYSCDPDGVCDRCGSEMRLELLSRGNVSWSCSKCKFSKLAFGPVKPVPPASHELTWEELKDLTSKPEVTFLIIGACHEYQRHQDADAERERIRGEFENLIRAKVAGIGLIVEEAGKNEQVQARLKGDAAKSPEFDLLFPALVNEPQETIARLLADELVEGNYADIRPPDADKMTIAQRDAAMTTKIMKSLGSAKSVLVICGEKHRAGLTRHLVDHGLRLLESLRFPDQCADEAEDAR